MNTPKHTPGPWSVCQHSPSMIEANIGHDDGLPRIIAQALDPIPHIGDAMVNANARLIASAPELLEALVAARSEIWRLLDAKGVEPKQARQWPEIVAAEFAIAKALGA